MPDTEQEYKKQIKELEQQVRPLKEQVDFLTRKLYGTKSEKTSALETEGQMSLFNEMKFCAGPDAHEPDLVEVEKHLRKRKYAGQREKLIKDIPRSKVLHTIDESEQICERCGSAMVKVGEEFVRTEVQFIPASLKVVEHYRETYECRTYAAFLYPNTGRTGTLLFYTLILRNRGKKSLATSGFTGAFLTGTGIYT